MQVSCCFSSSLSKVCLLNSFIHLTKSQCVYTLWTGFLKRFFRSHVISDLLRCLHNPYELFLAIKFLKGFFFFLNNLAANNSLKIPLATISCWYWKVIKCNLKRVFKYNDILWTLNFKITNNQLIIINLIINAIFLRFLTFVNFTFCVYFLESVNTF